MCIDLIITLSCMKAMNSLSRRVLHYKLRKNPKSGEVWINLGRNFGGFGNCIRMRDEQ